MRALNQLRKKQPHLNYKRVVLSEHILQEAQLYHSMLSILYVQMKGSKNNQDHPNLEAIRKARVKLIKQLEWRLDRNLERIFRLLGLKYPPDDILNILNSLKSKKSDS